MATVNNFKYGEVSQMMSGRLDLDTYTQGVARLENMYVRRQGGISRRWPFKGNTLEGVTDAVRIRQFFISDNEQFIIVFRVSCVTVLTIGEDGLVSSRTDVNYPSGYTVTEARIKRMCFAQYYQYLFITCDELPVARLHLVGSSLVFEVPKILLNQDGKVSLNRDFSFQYYEDGVRHTKRIVSSAVHDKDTDKYKYTETVYIDGVEIVSERKEMDIEIEGEDDWNNGVLNTGEGYYPSGCSIISDRLWLYGCKNRPSTIWASRVYGSSQFLDNEDDSLLDFIQFHITETTTETLKDPEQWPKTPVVLTNGEYAYHSDLTINSDDSVVFQSKNASGALKYNYMGQASQPGARYIASADAVDDPKSNVPPKDAEGNYIWGPNRTDTLKSGRLWLKYYDDKKNADDDYFYTDEDGEVKTIKFKDLAEKTENSRVLMFHFVDSDYTAGQSAPPIDKNHFYDGHYCYRWREDYDISDESVLTESLTSMAFSANASTAMEIQLATGRNDRVMWMGSGTNIYVGTQASVWMMPTTVNPIEGAASRFNANQSVGFQCQYIGPACVYVSKGRKTHLITDGPNGTGDNDITVVSENIIDGEIRDICTLTTPLPMVSVIMGDGSLRNFIYDESSGIQAWSRWSGSFDIMSMCNYERGDDVLLYALYRKDGKVGIGRFDYTEDRFTDVIDEEQYPFVSRVVLNRMDSMTESSSTMGYMKAVGRSTIRAYRSGKAYFYYDEALLNLTPKNLTDDNGNIGDFCDDYVINPYGGSKDKLNLTIEAHMDEPLNILALAYEGRVNI